MVEKQCLKHGFARIMGLHGLGQKKETELLGFPFEYGFLW